MAIVKQEMRMMSTEATGLVDASEFDDSYLSDSSDCSSDKMQRPKVVLPLGFLDPLPPEERALIVRQQSANRDTCRHFWKAGDYEPSPDHSNSHTAAGTMDHARVHPKFLHSNATSHKWALGAFAELLDNALDEVCNGATYVHGDMLKNEKDGSKMLLVEDNGGGMTPDRMRQCMSLGYSMKSKLANTIGKYGNGFKTSTMRLGADVIVFSRCRGIDGRSPTQSIGLLSYTFLRKTGKEDIVVPMIDYEKVGEEWTAMVRYSPNDWTRNLETILTWSPYASEESLLYQFHTLEDQGTRIVIFNLWEDEGGDLELDFDTDHEDIQIRGVNRDEKKIEMANTYPNLTHFLTYRHSLRNYAAILYLRLPQGFRIILRGKDVVHHNLVDDMILPHKVTYKPVSVKDGEQKNQNMVAVITCGFVKDAKHHLDVQGFNVYHKNRLIKPFYRVWNAAGSDGRGVIGVLEANFIEPAHDKQGFERTLVLSRLETKLIAIQKNYWSTNCHLIGYAPRRHKTPKSGMKVLPAAASTHSSKSNDDGDGDAKRRRISSHSSKSSVPTASVEDNLRGTELGEDEMGRVYYETPTGQRKSKQASAASESNNSNVILRKDNRTLVERSVEQRDGVMVVDLLRDLEQEQERNKVLVDKLHKAVEKMEEMDREHEALITIFAEERQERETNEEQLNVKLKGASDTIRELENKVKLLEERSRP